MKIQVSQDINKEYYNEYYSEWLKFRSKFKKWENIIGFISLTASLVIYLFDDSLIFISVGLFVFGSLMVYEYYSSKSKWLKGRLNSKMIDTKVTLIFEEERIQTFGPFTEMNGKWDFFSDAVKTDKGLILVPENGISIYLQNKAFANPSDIEAVFDRIKKN
ncbi:hypothetical protein [Nibribacter koreensis]|uniref:YcxB-like protein n=1 Tax=Nibribacter koreensis TaxID=1084519 RepID=A0ABP8FGF8_9BACT